ncbi:GIY-YIG nuclease family protein [Vibrio metschnikovii]|uniref:GIY-YIG nuclease family protein n=2 Tax=Vibrio metschnikovii TaxID=28172 RepID=UPI003556B194
MRSHYLFDVYGEIDLQWRVMMDYIDKLPCIYILASKPYGSLYIGVTSNLPKRIWEHKNHIVKGFTEKYQITNLVYYQQFETMQGAIYREKQLKKWNRQWKIRLICEQNPNWIDLYYSL